MGSPVFLQRIEFITVKRIFLSNSVIFCRFESLYKGRLFLALPPTSFSVSLISTGILTKIRGRGRGFSYLASAYQAVFLIVENCASYHTTKEGEIERSS